MGKQRGRLVVLFDDDATITAMYRIGLEFAGYEVATCNSEKEFDAVLERQPADVVVLDWSMPGKSGGEILEGLRQNQQTRCLKVLILSGLARPDAEAEAARSAGAVAWLDKASVVPAKLAEEIAHLFPD